LAFEKKQLLPVVTLAYVKVLIAGEVGAPLEDRRLHRRGHFQGNVMGRHPGYILDFYMIAEVKPRVGGRLGRSAAEKIKQGQT